MSPDLSLPLDGVSPQPQEILSVESGGRKKASLGAVFQDVLGSPRDRNSTGPLSPKSVALLIGESPCEKRISQLSEAQFRLFPSESLADLAVLPQSGSSECLLEKVPPQHFVRLKQEQWEVILPTLSPKFLDKVLGELPDGKFKWVVNLMSEPTREKWLGRLVTLRGPRAEKRFKHASPRKIGVAFDLYWKNDLKRMERALPLLDTRPILYKKLLPLLSPEMKLALKGLFSWRALGVIFDSLETQEERSALLGELTEKVTLDLHAHLIEWIGKKEGRLSILALCWFLSSDAPYDAEILRVLLLDSGVLQCHHREALALKTQRVEKICERMSPEHWACILPDIQGSHLQELRGLRYLVATTEALAYARMAKDDFERMMEKGKLVPELYEDRKALIQLVCYHEQRALLLDLKAALKTDSSLVDS